MEFLLANVEPSATVWEWGSGETTALLAQRCRHITTVEHQPVRAAQMALWSATTGVRVSVLSMPYAEGGEDDGDLATFRSYVESYSGRGVDVVLIDGRARVECARWVAERAPFGPTPQMRIFAHDIERRQLAPILEMFREEKRIGRLALLRMRMP